MSIQNEAEQYLEKGIEQKRLTNYESSSQLLKKASLLFAKLEMWDKWAYAQNTIGVNQLYLNNRNNLVNWFDSVLELSDTDLSPRHIERGKAYSNLGVCHRYNQEYNQALYSYQQAIEIISQHSDRDSVHAYINMGSCYFAKGDNEQAISHYKKALQIAEKLPDEVQYASTILAMNGCGNCYSNSGDYSQALRYFQKSLHLCEQYLPKNHPHTARIYNNIAYCLQQQKRYQEALIYLQKALVIFQQIFDEKHLSVVSVQAHIGHCHKLLQDFSKAMDCFQKVWKIESTQSPLRKTKALYHLGDGFFSQRKYKKAIEHYQLGIINALDALPKHHPNLAIRYIKLGNCWLEWGKHDKSVYAYHEVLQCVIYSFNNQDIYVYPKVEAKYYQSVLHYLDALKGKAQALFSLYKENKTDTSALKASFVGYKRAIHLSRKINQSYLADDSKLFLTEKKQEIFDKGIEASLCLWHQRNTFATFRVFDEQYKMKEQAFDFSEQSKATLLLSSLKDSEAKAAANIPKELLQKERQLKIELNYFDKSIATQEAKGDKKDEGLLSKFQSQYFDYKQQYDELIEQFEADYPEYYQLKYAVETASVEEVQRYLNTQTSPLPPSKGEFSAIISYHIAEEKIYIFTITANDYQIHTLEKPSNFAELITDFQDAIALGDIDEYMDSGSILFDLLLLPALKSIPNTSKLILIPHNELTTVSFDALIDTRKLEEKERAKISADCDFSALPYLIKDYDISYHYSATMLLHSVARQEQAAPKPANFVGFAPVNFDGLENAQLALASNKGQTKVMRSNRAGEAALAKLPSTENEVKEIFQLFEAKELEAKAFLYASANKQNLFDNAPKHKYVLIATHGYVQDGNANLSGIYLARGQETGARSQETGVREEELDVRNQGSERRGQFNNQTIRQSNNYLLHTSEAYHLQLDADLVVLSSCSSGVGKLVTGEGMMAINRGFLYAGASNIIFTHFDIPDESSGELVKVLFEQILEGDSYASALRKAKLEVIQQSLKTPEDWAGYALIGV